MADTTDQTQPKTLVRYRNQAGAIVEVRTHIESHIVGLLERFTAHCPACLSAYEVNGRTASDHIDRPRAWAAEHSASCRALPQPEDDQR